MPIRKKVFNMDINDPKRVKQKSAGRKIGSVVLLARGLRVMA
jgi:hypothetical protein